MKISLKKGIWENLDGHPKKAYFAEKQYNNHKIIISLDKLSKALEGNFKIVFIFPSVFWKKEDTSICCVNKTSS